MSLFVFNEDLQTATKKGYKVMTDRNNERIVGSYGQETDDYLAAAGGESSADAAQKAVNVVLDSVKEAAANPENVDVNKVEKDVDKAVEAVKDCGNQSWLEKQKAKLEAKIKEYDNKFKQMEEENKKNGGSSIGNKLKWIFTKIKQLFLKLIKAIVSALASIQNKFRSKKESK